MTYAHEIKFIPVNQLDWYAVYGWRVDYVSRFDKIIRIRRLVRL